MPKVRDIMTIEIRTAEPETTLEELAGMMRDENVGGIPVLDDGELVGIVTDRDIVVRCIAQGADPSEMTADEVISEDLQTVSPDDDVRDASRIMADRQIRRLPVVEDDRLVGMISLGDIAVKHDEQASGEVLEDISEGVKPSHSTGKKKPVPISRGRSSGAVRAPGTTRQGISQESEAKEQHRQQRVNPARASRSSTVRRKAG